MPGRRRGRRRQDRHPHRRPPLTLWGRGLWRLGAGQFHRQHTAGDDRSLTGFLTGFDYAFAPGWRAGLAAGYSRSDFNVDARASSGDSDNYDRRPLWRRHPRQGRPGVLALRAGAAYAWHDLSVDRTAAVGSFTDSLSSGYKGSTAQVFAELGYGIDLGKTPVGAARVEPFAGLAYIDVSRPTPSPRPAGPPPSPSAAAPSTPPPRSSASAPPRS